MIESLVIKNVATYDNTGIQINELKKINFIYGANGCGKTTVSNFLYNQTEPNFENCSINWKVNIPLKTLVYNKDFRERNFGNGTIDGVFTLGQATKEQAEEIEVKRKELKELKDKGTVKRETVVKLAENKIEFESTFKENSWSTIYKKYEPIFKEAFKGFMQKESFKNKIVNEYKNNTTELKTFDYLIDKSKTIFGEIPQSLNLINQLDYNRSLEIETDEIWTKKIIGKSDVDIAKLIQKLNLNDWVNEGRNYILENETCPFCQQNTITGTFKSQLEDYFDKEFIADTELVKSHKDEYNLIALNLINELQQIEIAEKLNKNSKLNLDSFSAYIITLSSQFTSNKELLNNKFKEPSRSIELISVKEQLDNILELITSANSNIKAHNKIVTNYTTEKTNLINHIWKFLITENDTPIKKFTKKNHGLEKGIIAINKVIANLLEAYKKLDKKIIDLAKNVTSIQPSVDEINKTLKSFGFINFEIKPSLTGRNQYQIQREDGTLAESTLSEGEITFITFLYFLQLAKGSASIENITEERILIVDDPISSLDSNVLFIVKYSYQRNNQADKKDEGSIRQIILLTHNVYFHKEVSFIDGRTKENSDTFYFIIRKNENISSIQPFEMKNPIQNSYELLWQELKNRANSSGITIQNIMRRIIENYFKILGKYGDDELISKFDNPQEQEICRSLICWINDGSHSIPDDLYVERQENTIENYNRVFKSIFKETGHIEHYNMMTN